MRRITLLTVGLVIIFCILKQNDVAADTLYVAAGSQQGPESLPTIYKIDLNLKKVIDNKSYGKDISTSLVKLGPNLILTTTTIPTSKMFVISPQDLGVKQEMSFEVGLLRLVQLEISGPVWFCGQDREHRNFVKRLEIGDKDLPEIETYKQLDPAFFVTKASAFSKTQNRVYTGLSYKEGGPIMVFDAATSKKIREIRAVPNPWMPSYLTISGNGKYLFVKLFNGDTKERRVGVVDLIAGKLTKQLIMPAWALVSSSRGDKLLVLCIEPKGLGKVVVVDALNLDVLEEIGLDNTAKLGALTGMAVSKDDKYVVVLFSGYGSLGRTQPGYVGIVDIFSKDVNYISLEVGAPVGAIIVP